MKAKTIFLVSLILAFGLATPAMADTAITSGRARDAADGDRVVALDAADGSARITETIGYENLTPGGKYTVELTLFDKDDASRVSDSNGELYLKKKEFIPEGTASFVSIDLPISDIDLDEGEDVLCTVFYTVKDEDGTIVAKHVDENDSKQTFVVVKPQASVQEASAGSSSEPVETSKTIEVFSFRGLVLFFLASLIGSLCTIIGTDIYLNHKYR